MNSSNESTLGILDIEKLCEGFDSVQFYEKLNQSTSVLTQRQESVRQSLRSSCSSPLAILDLLDKGETEKHQKSVRSLSVPSTSGTVELDSKLFNDSLTFDPTCLHSSSFTLGLDEKSSLKAGESKSSRVPINSTVISNSVAQSTAKTLDEVFEDSLNVPARNGNIETKTRTLGDLSQPSLLGSEKIVFLPQEIAARSTSVHEEAKAAVCDSWDISGFNMDFIQEKSKAQFSESAFQGTFLSGDEAREIINKEQKENEKENALEISENHDFGRWTPLEMSAAGHSVTASKVFGHQSWRIGSEMDRPSFGMLLRSPLRQMESTIEESNIGQQLSDLEAHNKSSLAKCSGIPKQRADSNVVRRKTQTIQVNLPPERDPQEPVVIQDAQSPENENPQAQSISVPVERSLSPKSGCSSLSVSPVPGASSFFHTSEASTMPVSQLSCQCSGCSRGPLYSSSSEQEMPFKTYQARTYHSDYTSVYAVSQKALHPVSPFQQHCLQSPGLQLCPNELPLLTVCLGECVKASLPVENPFPQSLQFQLGLTNAFRNEQVCSNANLKSLISWSQQEYILSPHQKKEVQFTFSARISGQLHLPIEVQWSTGGCPTIPSKMGKSTCILTCDIVVPKLTVVPENLKIRYHSSSNTAETAFFTLLNHTPVPVTVGLDILRSPSEDHKWKEAEFFFSPDHIGSIPGNNVHQWLNVSSPTTLSLLLVAGTQGIPSKAAIPVSLHIPQSLHQSYSNFENDSGATIIVSQRNVQPARRLTAIRISATSSQAPLQNAFSKLSQQRSSSGTPSLGMEIPNIKSKKNVFFPPTDLNTTRKEEVVLRNLGTNCKLSAFMQHEGSAFQLVAELCHPSGNKWLLNKNESLTLALTFKPTQKVGYQEALVIGAATADGCTTYSKIILHGYGGCSKLTLHGMSTSGLALQRQLKSLRFTKGVGEEKQLVFLNQGSRPAFVSLTQTPAVSYSGTKIVVLPYSQETITLTCRSNCLDENLMIFYGEELLRKVVSKRLPSLKKPGLLHMFDASGSFRDQEKVPPEILYPVKDITALGDLFYKHVSYFELCLTNKPIDSLDTTTGSMEFSLLGD